MQYQGFGQQTLATQLAIQKANGRKGGKRSASKRRGKKKSVVRVRSKSSSVTRRAGKRTGRRGLVKGSAAAKRRMAALRKMRRR
jgi:hypothetical protein